MVQRRGNDRGDTLITVAILLMTLLAMLAVAIDVGVGYAQRRLMQNAADAGALAGAWVLAEGARDAEIEAAVREYTIVQNHAESFVASYIPSDQEIGHGSIPANTTGVKVTASSTVQTFFAGLIGFNTISADAEAGGGFSPLDLVLVLDRSGSMDDDSCSVQPWPSRCGTINQTQCTICAHGTWWLPPQPITDAKNAAAYFVDLNTPNLSHLALVSYANDYTLNQPLTGNLAAVRSAIGGLTANGCTNAPGGLATAIGELNGPRRRADAARFIVFLTDGLPNLGLSAADGCGSSCPNYCPQAKTATRAQADLAVQNQIVIYTIALGANADRSLMQDIATRTGGEFFYAPTSAQLQGVYQTIFDRIKLRLVR